MAGPDNRDGYRNRKVFVRTPGSGLATEQVQKKPARVPYEEMQGLSIQRAIAQALRKKG